MVENMESIVEEYRDTRQLLVSVQLLQIKTFRMMFKSDTQIVLDTYKT